MTSWSLKDWLEAFAYFVTIWAPITTGLVFLLRKRSQDIDKLRADMARAWTNEGDISSDESIMVHLSLVLEDGDVYGTLQLSTYDRPLEAHLNVRWRHATLVVTELMGRGLMPVAHVRLALVGNRNRLDWRLKKLESQHELPRRTLLWPSRLPDTQLLGIFPAKGSTSTT